MARDLRDFGFKAGDTMRATHPDQPARQGTVGWHTEMGMTLEWTSFGRNFESGLPMLHDLGWKFELIKRPLLNDKQRALANVLDDPNLHFAFRDIVNATAFSYRSMARVGVDFSVMVLPSNVREQWEANTREAGLPIRIYEGKLPNE